jgi:hypothetical protein
VAFFTLKDASGDVVSVSSLRELAYWTALGYQIQGDTYQQAAAALGASPNAYAPQPVNPPGLTGEGLTIAQIAASPELRALFVSRTEYIAGGGAVDNGDGTFTA